MRHIGVEAKNEALETLVSRKDNRAYTSLHLEYYIDHTNPQIEPKRTVRKFDDNLSLKDE